MPLYEYECPNCGTFERVQKFSDPILTECPTCGKSVEKLLSAPAIQFKGTGWYVTDYARKSSGKEGKEGGKEGKEGGKEGKDAKEGGAGKDKKDSGGKSESSSARSTDKKSSDKT